MNPFLTCTVEVNIDIRSLREINYFLPEESIQKEIPVESR
jgi:hypothetical protein